MTTQAKRTPDVREKIAQIVEDCWTLTAADVRSGLTRSHKAADAILSAYPAIVCLENAKRKVREALAALIKHADELEARQADYHYLAENGQPLRSGPLNAACAALALLDGEGNGKTL